MSLPVCDHSQGFYVPPNRRRSIVFGFYSNKQTNKQANQRSVLCLFCLSTCMRVCLQVQGPLRECLRTWRFRATLLLHMRSWCNLCAICVVTKKIMYSNMILRLPIPPGRVFFRWTWTSILLPENWVSWISLNIWRDMVSTGKWTHWLLKEGNNLERGLYCTCWGYYPRLSGGMRNLIKKVSVMERLPWCMSTIEHW